VHRVENLHSGMGLLSTLRPSYRYFNPALILKVLEVLHYDLHMKIVYLNMRNPSTALSLEMM
jgi:hypothetical protein